MEVIANGLPVRREESVRKSLSKVINTPNLEKKRFILGRLEAYASAVHRDSDGEGGTWEAQRDSTSLIDAFGQFSMSLASRVCFVPLYL